MRKLVTILIILLISSFMYSWDGGYSIPCYSCTENTLYNKRGYSACMGCPMWRCYGEEIKAKFKGYMVYRCQHGHCILIPISSEDKSRDLNELIVYKANGTKTSLNKDLINRYSR